MWFEGGSRGFHGVYGCLRIFKVIKGCLSVDVSGELHFFSVLKAIMSISSMFQYFQAQLQVQLELK